MNWEKQEGRGKVWILSTCPNEKDFDEKNKKKFDPKKLYYNIKGHIDPNVRCTGDALEECVQLALLSEKQMRRPIVISSYAAEDCDSAVTRLQRFSHDLIEYFTPISLENLRLDEPPAERLVGRYNYDNNNHHSHPPTVQNVPIAKIDDGATSNSNTRTLLSSERVVSKKPPFPATSSTTSAAFLSTGLSTLMPISSFGFFAGILIPINFLLTIFFFPSVLIIYEKKLRNKC